MDKYTKFILTVIAVGILSLNIFDNFNKSSVIEAFRGDIKEKITVKIIIFFFNKLKKIFIEKT